MGKWLKWQVQFEQKIAPGIMSFFSFMLFLKLGLLVIITSKQLSTLKVIDGFLTYLKLFLTGLGKCGILHTSDTTVKKKTALNAVVVVLVNVYNSIISINLSVFVLSFKKQS